MSITATGTASASGTPTVTDYAYRAHLLATYEAEVDLAVDEKRLAIMGQLDGGHPEPIMRYKPCPPELLPDNAARLLKRAESRGLKNRATIAIGFREFGRQGSGDFRPVRSILVKVQGANGKLAALWVGSVDGENMGFKWAWRVPGPVKLAAAELAAEVDAL